MKKISSRLVYGICFALVALLLGFGFYLQMHDGLVPCPLCVLQRIDLGILGIVFFIGMVSCVKKFGQVFIASFANLVSILGILLSGRQVWLQHLPPDNNADCAVSLQYLLNVLPFDQALKKVLQGTAECSKTGWQFLQLSMAEWSLLCFIFFFLISLWLIDRAARD